MFRNLGLGFWGLGHEEFSVSGFRFRTCGLGLRGILDG